jgi:hypothetical protein
VVCSSNTLISDASHEKRDLARFDIYNETVDGQPSLLLIVSLSLKSKSNFFILVYQKAMLYHVI